MINKSNKIKGLIVAPFTAFDSDNNLAMEQVAKQAAMYKRNGISGAFICGTTGESSALTLDEKKKLFMEWSKYRTDDFKVIGFLGGTCLAECIELARYAEDLQLDAVSVTAPYYFKANSIGKLTEFCMEVAKVVPTLPLYYYHIPSFTNAHFPMIDLLRDIDGKVPNFAGIKYTHENLMDYQLCLNFEHNKYDILWGRDEMLLAALAMGAKGAVGSTYGYMAPVYSGVIEEFERNNLEKARDYQLAANKLIGLLGKYGGGAGKAYMREAGIELGEHRLPVENLTAGQQREFRIDLVKLQFKTYMNR
jgi:N-acetylneuraminate lyase